MQYDLILWFIMYTIWWFNRDTTTTKLPLLILSSNFICLLLFKLPDSYTYYYLEGVRHTTTILLVFYLFTKERAVYYYLSYFLIYIGISALYLTGIFAVLSNIDIDTIGVALNTLEFMVFIYGILFIKDHSSCPDSR